MKYIELACDEEITATLPPHDGGNKANLGSNHGTLKQLPDIKPTNFVQVSRRNDWLRGSWVIDPTMIIPSMFLPPLSPDETEETRSNILLGVTQSGSVYVDIFFMSAVPSLKDPQTTFAHVHKQRIYIQGSCRNGNITMKVHEPVPSKAPTATSTEMRWPLQVDCSSVYGSVVLYIPRSFHGPMNFKVSNGTVHFSIAVKPMVTLFSDNEGVQRSFLGDFNGVAIQESGEWTGDILSAKATNGTIRIYFEDEDLPTQVPKSGETKGFIERWFGP